MCMKQGSIGYSQVCLACSKSKTIPILLQYLFWYIFGSTFGFILHIVHRFWLNIDIGAVPFFEPTFAFLCTACPLSNQSLTLSLLLTLHCIHFLCCLVAPSFFHSFINRFPIYYCVSFLLVSILFQLSAPVCYLYTLCLFVFFLFLHLICPLSPIPSLPHPAGSCLQLLQRWREGRKGAGDWDYISSHLAEAIIIVIVVFLLLTSHHHHLTSSPASHKPHSAWSAGQCLAGRPLSGPATLDFKIRYYENCLTLKYGEIKLPCRLLEWNFLCLWPEIWMWWKPCWSKRSLVAELFQGNPKKVIEYKSRI